MNLWAISFENSASGPSSWTGLSTVTLSLYCFPCAPMMRGPPGCPTAVLVVLILANPEGDPSFSDAALFVPGVPTCYKSGEAVG